MISRVDVHEERALLVGEMALHHEEAALQRPKRPGFQPGSHRVSVVCAVMGGGLDRDALAGKPGNDLDRRQQVSEVPTSLWDG